MEAFDPGYSDFEGLHIRRWPLIRDDRIPQESANLFFCAGLRAVINDSYMYSSFSSNRLWLGNRDFTPRSHWSTIYHYNAVKKIMKSLAHSGGKTERWRWSCPKLSMPLDIKRYSLESVVCPIIIIMNLLDCQAQTPASGSLPVEYCTATTHKVLTIGNPALRTYLSIW